MADSFILPPRRLEWIIKLHPGEVKTNLVGAYLVNFNDRELEEIKQAIETEINRRSEANVPTETE